MHGAPAPAASGSAMVNLRPDLLDDISKRENKGQRHISTKGSTLARWVSVGTCGVQHQVKCAIYLASTLEYTAQALAGHTFVWWHCAFSCGLEQLPPLRVACRHVVLHPISAHHHYHHHDCGTPQAPCQRRPSPQHQPHSETATEHTPVKHQARAYRKQPRNQRVAACKQHQSCMCVD